MRNAETHAKSHKYIAALLCLCMVMSLFCGFGATRLVSRAAEGDKVTQGVKQRQADPSTMDTYKNYLNLSVNTRYAGRLWSDKTVFAYGESGVDATGSGRTFENNKLLLTKDLDGLEDGPAEIELDSDFLHVYSVLGSSEQINEPAPVDMVLALDISGSMGSPEENETSGWVNTVHLRDGGVVADPDGRYGVDELGYYVGHNGADSNLTDPAKDDNGIPDAIVGVLPSDSYAA